MNAEQFADRIADRVYTGYAASGPDLRNKIKSVVRETLAEYEPEARRLERELEVVKGAHKGILSMMHITIADARLERAKARREAADNTVQYLALRLAIRTWENHTGLNHDKLLEGTYHDPYGT